MPVNLIAYPFTSQVTYDPVTDLPIYDRAVDSEVLRNVLKQYFSNGVFANPATSFQVYTEDNGLNVVVRAGSCNINGCTGYTQTDSALALEAAGSSARTDAIVLRWDENIDVRNVLLDAVTGTSTAKYTPTRNATVYELVIAYVTVGAGVTVINAADIEDARLNTDLCGLVRLPMTVPDTDPYFTQIQSTIDALRDVIGQVISGDQYMLKTQYGPDTVAQMTSGTLQVNSVAARFNTSYPIDVDIPVDYTPQTSMVLDGDAVQILDQAGEVMELNAAPGAVVSFNRRGAYVFPKSGGSAGRNYDVVGGTVRPLAKENRFWVNTSQDIPSYYLTETPNPSAIHAAGLVLPGTVIVVCAGNKYPFIAYKGKHGSEMMPITSYQWSGSAWILRSVEFYNGGTWRRLVTYLYNRGDQRSEITGGWTSYQHGTEITGSVSMGASYMTASVSGVSSLASGWHALRSMSTINLTDFRTATVQYSYNCNASINSADSRVGFSTSAILTDGSQWAVNVASNTNGVTLTQTMNISALGAGYYCHAWAYLTGYIVSAWTNVYYILLET